MASRPSPPQKIFWGNWDEAPSTLFAPRKLHQRLHARLCGSSAAGPADRPFSGVRRSPSKPDPSILQAVSQQGASRGITVENVYYLLPPTRTYTGAEATSALQARGINAVLIMQLGDSGIHQQYLGTIVSANSSGSFNGSGTAVSAGPFTSLDMSGTMQSSGTAIATPILRPNRSTTFQARLVEVPTGRVLWVGQGETDSGGLLFVGMNGAKSVSSVFDDLQAKGILPAASS
jgi:hypothetical protein